MEKSVLLSVDIEYGEAIKRTVQLRQEQKALASTSKDLEKQFQKGELSAEQLTDALAQNEIKARQNGVEMGRLNSIIKASEKSNKAAAGSLNEMKAQVILLTDQYDRLSKEERENEKIGGKLQKQIRSTSDELKKQKEAIGDTRLNVGNYSSSIRDALKDLNIFGIRVGDVADNLGKAKDGFQSYTAGVGKAGTAMRALIAVPIIAVLLGVVAVMTQFDDIMDEVEAGTKGLTAGFKVFIRTFEPIGRQVIDILSGIGRMAVASIKTLYSLATLDFKAAKENLGAYADALGDVFKSTKGLVDDAVSGKLAAQFGEASAAAKEATIAMYELTKQTQELEDAENALRVSRAESDKQTRLALLAAKDRGKTEQERLDLLVAAGKTEEEVFAKELKHSRERLLIAQKEALILSGATELANKLRVGQEAANQAILDGAVERFKIQDQYVEAVQEAQVKVIGMEAEAAETQQRIENRTFTFRKEIRIKALENDKAFHERQVLQAQEANKKTLEVRNRALDDQLAVIRRQRDVELENEELTQNQRALIVYKAEQEILKIRTDFAIKTIELRERSVADVGNAIFKEEKARQKALDDVNKRISDDMQKDIDLRKKQSDARLDIKRRETEQEVALERAKYDAIMSITDGLSGLSSLLARNSAQAADFQKAIALFQISVDTAKAISSTIANATTAASAGGPAAPFLAATYIASGVATVLANIAQAKQLIQGQTPQPSFYEGGMYGYTGDGTPTSESTALGKKPYTYHKREMIVPDRVMRRPDAQPHVVSLFRMMKETMPEHRLRGFANGGFASVSAAVGSAINPERQQEQNGQNIENALARVVANMPRPVVDVREIARVSRRVEVKERSGL